MKKNICIAFTIFFFSFLSNAAEQKSITIIADEWCPYNCTPETEDEVYVLEIAREVFSVHGIEVTYKILNWNRALKEVRKGTYNAAIAASKEEAKNFIFPEEPIGISSYSFYGKTGMNWKYKGIKSLKGKTLGSIDGYKYFTAIDDYIKHNRSNNLKVQVLSDADALGTSLKKLAAGRIDLFIEQYAVANYTIKKMQLEDKISAIDRATYKFEPEKHKFYLAFSPSDPNSKKYAKIFDNGIKDLRESGRLLQILNKYNLNDWVY
ncbi:MAG TPA: hypothetical protein DIV86_03695 [Alphaproteobacteria bacterium]|nr:hypothetical protein [Alphaproteobacteria bacterium]